MGRAWLSTIDAKLSMRDLSVEISKEDKHGAIHTQRIPCITAERKGCSRGPIIQNTNTVTIPVHNNSQKQMCAKERAGATQPKDTQWPTTETFQPPIYCMEQSEPLIK